jgi:predicted nuclease with TOPRIM domain
VKLESD